MDFKQKDAQGHIPLTASAADGDVERVSQLLDDGADIKGRGRSGIGALGHAAGKGHLPVVRLLIARGARIDAKESGCSPLMRAAGRGHRDCVTELVEAGARLDIATGEGWTAVCKAVAGASPDIVLYLLDQGAPMGTLFEGTEKQLIQWAKKCKKKIAKG